MKLNFNKLGEGHPLIILHGLFGQSDNWMTVGKKISERGYAVYLTDLRNHGRSPHSNDFNYDVLAEDVIELIHDQQLSQPAIIGHSLGGKTAMMAALKRTDLISKLAVIDIATKYYPVHHRDLIDALRSVNLNEVKSRGEVEKILSAKIKDTGTRQFLLKNLYWKNDSQLAWRLNLDGIESNIEEVSKEIVSDKQFVKPVLFVRGEKSNYILDDDLPKIKILFPNAELITIPNAGHWINADAPLLLYEKLIDFLMA